MSNHQNKTHCIVIGEGNILLACLDVLLNEDISIDYVVSSDAEVHLFAQNNNISILHDLSKLNIEEIDYILSINNPNVLNINLINKARLAAINYHDSLLPKYAGSHAATWALLNNEKEHGITWHIMAEGVDTGPILVQKSFGINSDDTAFTLNTKCFETAIKAFKKICRMMSLKKVDTKIAQDSNKRTYYLHCQKPQLNALITWENNATNIISLINALDYNHRDNPIATPKFWIGRHLVYVKKIVDITPQKTGNIGQVKHYEDNRITVNITDATITLECDWLFKGALDFNKLFAEEEIKIGDTLSFPDNINKKEIALYNNSAGRHESRVLNEFESYKPYTIFSQSYFYPAQKKRLSHPKYVDLDLRIDNTQLTKLTNLTGNSYRDTLFAILCIYLARTNNSNYCSFGLISKQATSPAIRQIFCDIIPITININEHNNLTSLQQYSNALLNEIDFVFPADVFARFHNLNKYKHLGLHEIYPIIIDANSNKIDGNQKNRNAIIIRIVDNGYIVSFNRKLINKDLWQTDDIDQAIWRFTKTLTDQFNAIANNLNSNHNHLLSATEIHDESYLKLIYDHWNNTSWEIDHTQLLHQKFLEMVISHPDYLAIISDEQNLTYKQLFYLSYVYYKKLNALNITSGDYVAIIIKKGWQQIVACMATLMSGAAYIPLNTEDPINRINDILIQSDIKLILTTKSDIHLNNFNKYKKIYVDHIDSPNDIKTTKIKPQNCSHDPAYVIFTSGTTGTPKGVIVTHRNVVNTIADINNRFEVSSNDRTFLLSELYFDLSVYDIFGPLSVGGAIVIPKNTHTKEPSYLIQPLFKHGVTIWNSVPAFMEMLVEYCNVKELTSQTSFSLRLILLSGDWIAPALPNKIRGTLGNDIKIVSLGGATEGSIWSIIYPIPATFTNHGTIPYGYPMRNQKMYILDNALQDKSIGIEGDIYIGGHGVSLGYLNNSTTTKDSFTLHPITRERIYRTGDLGRYYYDGCIEFRGRSDQQIKISGYRVELKEIEISAQKHINIKQATALLTTDSAKQPHIVLFILPSHAINLNINIIFKHLRIYLPIYMIPSKIIILDNIPLNKNNKIDYAKLTALAQDNLSANRTNTEIKPVKNRDLMSKIIRIWQDVLKQSIQQTDDFVALGASSLNAIRIISRLQTKIGLEVSLREFYNNTTPLKLYSLASHQAHSGAIQPTLSHNLDKNISVELTANQKRIWFLCKSSPLSPFYNMSFVYTLNGKLDRNILHKTFDALVFKFDALRSSVFTNEGTPKWKVAQQAYYGYKAIQLGSKNNNPYDRANIEKTLRHEANQPFDLELGPLFRVTIIEIDNLHFVLMINSHHIIFDGWSWGILIRELAKLYNQYHAGETRSLKPAKITQLDYCRWENNHITDKKIKDDTRFWIQHMQNGLPKLKIPLDKPRPRTDSYSGKNYYFAIPYDLSMSIKKYSKSNIISEYALLLSLFSTLLHSYTLQDDIVLGASSANRGLEDFENVIGFFANTMLLKLHINQESSFNDHVKYINNILLETLEHQSLTFNRIVELSNPVRESNINPLFQVAFVLLNMEIPSLKLHEIESEQLDLDMGISKFDLTVYLYDGEQGFSGYIEYNTDLFCDNTIANFANCYLSVTRFFMQHQNLNLSSLIFDIPQIDMTNSTWKPSHYEEMKHISSINSKLIEMTHKQPDKTAIKYQDLTISYQELYDKALHLSYDLNTKYNLHQDYVCICLDRSIEMIIAIIAILLSGNAYVPIDPSAPKQRFNTIISDTKSNLLITKPGLINQYQEYEANILYIDDHNYNNTHQIDNYNPPYIALNQIAYIIYTSGTTGRPKGVMVSHKNLSRIFDSTKNQIKFDHRDTWILLHSYAFDFSVWEIFGALAHGGTLIIASEEISKSPKKLASLITQEKVTILNQTPTAFYQLVSEISNSGQDRLKNLRYIIFGGEKLNFSKLVPWIKIYGLQQPILINMYGITETTIHATCHTITYNDVIKDSSIIGKLLPDLFGIILDKNGNAVPQGIPGELYIGGAGVTCGYIGDPDLTNKKFINYSDTLLYKTGDLVRHNSNNKLEYLKRIDRQIKIRGYRIELSEIELALKRFPFIENAIVIPNNEDEETIKLVAFIVINDNHLNDKLLLNEHLCNWRNIFDSVYTNTVTTKNNGFNISGWNSSHDNRPLSANEMREWLHHITDIIMSMKPSRVLEIGCGTGLLLLNLHKKTQQYTATDISKTAIETVEQQLALNHENYSNVTLLCQEAKQLGNLDLSQFDTVIINSVSQYFPNGHYLDHLIRTIAENISTGRLIIGDVRNLALLEDFYKFVISHQLKYKPMPCDFEKIIKYHLNREKELLVDPNYFFTLPNRIPTIKAVNIYLKQGTSNNELSLFRYDVVLFIENKNFKTLSVKYYWWGVDYKTIDKIRKHLETNKPKTFGIHNFPNPRFIEVDDINDWINHQTKQDYSSHKNSHKSPSIHDCKYIASYFDEIDYIVRFLLDPKTKGRTLNLVFIHKNHLVSQHAAIHIQPHITPQQSYNIDTLFNTPILNFIDLKRIRDELLSYLPAYEIPSSIHVLDKIPLTISGKIDHKELLNSASTTIHTQETFEAPKTYKEQLVANAWTEYLGIEIVGLHDNFFDLGGDSISSIMIVSRLTQLGFSLSPRDIFENQTVFELSNLIQSNSKEKTLKLPIGNLPLLPIQSWFFSRLSRDPNSYCYLFTLNVKYAINNDLLYQAISIVTNGHDSFRLRYKKTNNQWVQSYAIGRKLYAVDFIPLSKDEHDDYIDNLPNQSINYDVNIAEGPLIRFIVIQSERNHLLIAAHHLIMDGISMRLIIEDLNNTYEALEKKNDINLIKTAPISEWIEMMRLTTTLEKQDEYFDFWINLLPNKNEYISLIANHKTENNLFDIVEYTINIPSNTNIGLQFSQFEIALSIVLYAILNTVCKHQVLIDVEHHGRDTFQNINISRTLGWFTSIFPSLFSFDEPYGPNDYLRKVANITRLTKNVEHTFGMLKYNTDNKVITDTINALPDADILFNFHGAINQKSYNIFNLDRIIAPHDDHYQNYVAEINTYMKQDNLIIQFRYNTLFLSTNDLKSLKKRLNYAASTIASSKELTIKNVINNRSNKTLVHLPLTAMQDNLMRDSRYQLINNYFFHQLVLKFSDHLHPEHLKNACHQAIKNHLALRTIFQLDADGCVFACDSEHFNLNCKVNTIRDCIDEVDVTNMLAKHLAADQKKNFNLNQPPLIRFTLFQLCNIDILIITYQQLILDGWSISILLEEIAKYYNKHASNQIRSPDHLQALLQWQQNNHFHNKNIAFWKDYRFSSNVTPLLKKANVQFYHPTNTFGVNKVHSYTLTKTQTKTLLNLSQKNKTTLFVVVVDIWSRTLFSLSNNSSVQFGIMFSGRDISLLPANIDATKIIGNIINLSPFATKMPYTNTAESLADLQQKLLTLQENSGFSLSKIKKIANLNESELLFDSVLTYQNYPKWTRLQLNNARIINVDYLIKTNYPLTLRVTPGKCLNFDFCYDATVFCENYITNINKALKKTISELICNY